MVHFLSDNPLILLFLVVAIGHPLGSLKIGGARLGVVAVLFVGLAVGALSPSLKLPELVHTLGLSLFAYGVGLSSAPDFAASLAKDGLRNCAVTCLALLVAAAATVGVQLLLRLDPIVAAGVFAGSLTNTPALAGILETVRSTAPDKVAAPVAGYSICYPFGVMGEIAAILLLQRFCGATASGAAQLGDNQKLEVCTIEVALPVPLLLPPAVLEERCGLGVKLGRVKRGNDFFMADCLERLEPNDLVVAVGTRDELAKAVAFIGRRSSERIELETRSFDYRYLFVSNPALAGKRIGDLRLPELLGGIVTRIRRGDGEFPGHNRIAIEPGDQVRVLAPRERMDEARDFFGDSYHAVSEVNVLTFGLGLALGLLLGAVPIPLPGGTVFKLGCAGGPLVMALLLGALRRTAALVWTVPYGAGTAIRQLGLVLFLAGIGTRAGGGFLATFASGGGLVFGAGALVTAAAATTVVLAARALNVGHALIPGMLAGIFTQPAVLAYAQERDAGDSPALGYAAVYPTAMIAKIVLAQAILPLMK